MMVIYISCVQHKEKDIKTVFIDGGVQDEDVETLNGPVKEIMTGDSLKLKNFNHFYFDRKGNMLRANAKYVGYDDTLYRKVTYQSKFNKAGKKIEMSADYINYPDKCGCKGKLKWTFDGKGHVTEFLSDKHSFNSYIKYKYDPTGRLQYKESWGKLVVPDRYICSYDTNNRLTQLEHYQMGWDKEPPTALGTTNFKYLDFDSHNNWLIKIAGTDTITRKITYY